MRTRRLIERTEDGKLCAPAKEITDEATRMTEELLKKFPEVDANDIFLIIVRAASHACSMEMLRDVGSKNLNN